MFKKIYTLFLVLAFSAMAIAGTPKDAKMKAKAPMKAGYETEVISAPSLDKATPKSVRTSAVTGPGDSLGFTTYDYGTNGGPTDNIINYGDGTLSVGKMAAKAYNANAWPDRATYYSYYNGTSWTIKSARIETQRVGWGSIQQFKDGGGSEIVMSHVRPRVYIDASKGGNSWSESSPPATGIKGTTWPRMAVDAGLNVHIVGSPGTPDAKTPYYIRSTDAGGTWDTTKQTVFSTAGGGGDADAYDVAVSGAKVAIIQAGAGTDVVVATSANDGVSFTQTKIYDSKADSGSINLNENNPQPDGTVDLAYDNAGVLHAAWGTYMAIGDSMKRPSLFYSLKTGIYYWREGQTPKLVVLPSQDSGLVNGPLSLMPGVDAGFVGIPNIGFNATNNIYIVYQGQTKELSMPDSLPYCHIYAIYSSDGGSTWRGPTDLTPGTGFDASYPSLARKVDANLHMVYVTDAYPGNLVQGSQSDSTAVVKYLKFPVASLVSTPVVLSVGDNDNITGSPESYTLSQNFPNPFNPTTSISFSLPRAGQTTLKVYNMLGQEIATLVDEFRSAGIYTANFDASRLASGVYFYKLQSGSYLETKKMVFAK